MTPELTPRKLLLAWAGLWVAALGAPSGAGDLTESNALFARAEAQERAGDLPAALATARLLVRREDSYDAWLRLGWLANRTRDWGQAEEAYQRALTHSPTSQDALLGLLSLHDARGRWQDAESLARELVSRNRDNEMARRFLAHALFRTGQHARALTHYRTVAELAPEDGEIALGVALCLLHLGHRENAVPWLRKAETLLPAGDPRLVAAWRRQRGTLQIVPQAHFFQGSYSGSRRYQSYQGRQVLLDATDVDGNGLLLDHGSARVEGRNQPDLDKQRYGIGVTLGEGERRWTVHWARLEGAEAYLGTGNVFSLRHDRGPLGIAFDRGSWGSFETNQLTVHLTRELRGGRRLTWSPMLQYRSGPLLALRGEEEVLPSLGVRYEATPRDRLFWAQAWAGRRWFTSEGVGRLVWNADEEFDYGLELGLQLSRRRRISPLVSARLDHVSHVAGAPDDATVLTLNLGASFQF